MKKLIGLGPLEEARSYLRAVEKMLLIGLFWYCEIRDFLKAGCAVYKCSARILLNPPAVYEPRLPKHDR
jgi:hypothetical protein